MFRFWRSRKAPAAAAAPLQAASAAERADVLLQRLEWTVLRRLDGLLQGDYRTLLRGFGLDFADLREYQAQDDVRYIDWNVTARMDTPYVREFQEDREVEAWFVLDLSGSVDFGSVGCTKRDLAQALTGTMARLLTRRGNRVGAVLHGQLANVVPRVMPPRRGRLQVLQLLQALAAPTPASAGEGAAGLTDLAAVLRLADATIRRRSVLFVVSDFLSQPGWDEALARLARRHEVVAVRLIDPLERALPPMGFVVMQDAETGEQLLVDTQDSGFRQRFEQQAQAREAELRAACRRSGVDFLDLSTDAALAPALLAFVAQRKQRSRFVRPVAV
jgi:uncharacterized protein (DUF58 family)